MPQEGVVSLSALVGTECQRCRALLLRGVILPWKGGSAAANLDAAAIRSLRTRKTFHLPGTKGYAVVGIADKGFLRERTVDALTVRSRVNPPLLTAEGDAVVYLVRGVNPHQMDDVTDRQRLQLSVQALMAPAARAGVLEYNIYTGRVIRFRPVTPDKAGALLHLQQWAEEYRRGIPPPNEDCAVCRYVTAAAGLTVAPR